MRAIILGFIALAGGFAQDAAPQIDKIFERYDAKSPGCAVGVSRDGKPVFTKAYGSADLERTAPLTADSPFYMASVSKQFTAMSVMLLVEDGKIRLEDSIRKTIPELPEYANGVTIYHLLTHTSGVRDFLSLGNIAGRSDDFVYTEKNSLRLIARQRALNFEPGAEFLYSNSGYMLLSLVVKRVSGKSLNEFARERIFAPLGMSATLFQHDHSALIPGKALGYQQRVGGWRLSNSMLDVVGDGGLYSTVNDMLRWAANFDDPKVGAKVLATMQTAARLRDGKETQYGMGLAPGEYRGVRTVSHGGGLAGYRTMFLRFPEQRLNVICLCNNGTANSGNLAMQVAEVYLAAELKPKADPAKKNIPGVALTSDEVHAKVGTYRSEERGYFEFFERDNKLYLRGAGELIALDQSHFTSSQAPEGWELEFDSRVPPQFVTLKTPTPIRYDRILPVTLSEQDWKAYAGEYESAELEAVCHVSADAVGLTVDIGDAPMLRLRSAGADHMRAGESGSEFVFQRDSSGAITGFDLNAGRVRRVHFQRVPEARR